MGPAARDAAPDLEGGLDRPDPELRALAAIALWRTAGRRRLEPLAEAVDEAAREPLPLYGPPETLPPSFGPAREAAAVLAEMGPAAAEALPALARAIASPGARAIRADLERAAARLRS